MNDTLASTPHQAARPATRAGPADVSRRHLAALRNMITTWAERKRLRWELERKLKDDPYLIEDIGLTRRQADVEIAKPFWRA